MARTYDRFLTAFTAQASAAITADAFSGGALTSFDTTSTGNCDGAYALECEVDVTAAPSTEASCLIYMDALQHDGVGDCEPKLVGSITIPVTVTNKYITRIHNISEKGKLKLYAVNYGFTASLSVRGIYTSDT